MRVASHSGRRIIHLRLRCDIRSWFFQNRIIIIHSAGIVHTMLYEYTEFYRTCELPNPVLVLIEPRLEEPSPRLSSYLEVDSHRDVYAC